MNVLICGATGFVGGAIMEVLLQKGHTCIGGVRRPTEANHIAVDYLYATELGYWSKRLDGIDVVVNAVGVLRDTAKTPMKLLHHEAPAACLRPVKKPASKESSIFLPSASIVVWLPYISRPKKRRKIRFSHYPTK